MLNGCVGLLIWGASGMLLASGGAVSGKKKAHKHKSFWPVTPPVTRGFPDREAMGSKFYVLCSELQEHKSFSPDARPGGPVTEATGKSFMCKSFMCLFCSLLSATKKGYKHCFFFFPGLSGSSERGPDNPYPLN